MTDFQGALDVLSDRNDLSNLEKSACHDLQLLINAYTMLDKTINRLIEEKYEKHSYSCSGYFCAVATTCYSNDERKKICTNCLKERAINVDSSI